MEARATLVKGQCFQHCAILAPQTPFNTLNYKIYNLSFSSEFKTLIERYLLFSYKSIYLQIVNGDKFAFVEFFAPCEYNITCVLFPMHTLVNKIVLDISHYRFANMAQFDGLYSPC